MKTVFLKNLESLIQDIKHQKFLLFLWLQRLWKLTAFRKKMLQTTFLTITH